MAVGVVFGVPVTVGIAGFTAAGIGAGSPACSLSDVMVGIS